MIRKYFYIYLDDGRLHEASSKGFNTEEERPLFREYFSSGQGFIITQTIQIQRKRQEKQTRHLHQPEEQNQQRFGSGFAREPFTVSNILITQLLNLITHKKKRRRAFLSTHLHPDPQLHAALSCN